MKRIRIENRSRSKLRLPAVGKAPKDGVAPRDPSRDIVLGDAADTDELLELRGVPRSVRCPSPVWVGTDEDLARLAPSATKLLRALSSGDRPSLVVTELAA